MRAAMTNRMLLLLQFLVISSSLCASCFGEVFFEEHFYDDWDSRWVKSTWKASEDLAGDWNHTAGKFYGDEKEDKGIQTTPDAKFYAISAQFPEFSNKGKTLVIQFSVKHEQHLDCGGGYIKLLGGDVDQTTFGGDTPYSIMFGPDICGSGTKKVHAILAYKEEYHPIKKTISCETDEFTHLYTFIIQPDNSYTILIDNKEKESGSLTKDWKMLPPMKIKDPEAKKPEDWVEEEFIPDPSDVKPEDYDSIPAEIPDPNATQPEDWDEAEDGEWKPPSIPNPDYKGPWVQKKMKNPEYKGKWKHPMIDNPDYKDDPDLYVFPSLKYVGIEIWQVKSGSIFDNILITDDVEYAKNFAEEVWAKSRDGEKAAYDEDKKKHKDEEPEDIEDEDEDEDEEEVTSPSDLPEVHEKSDESKDEGIDSKKGQEEAEEVTEESVDSKKGHDEF